MAEITPQLAMWPVSRRERYRGSQFSTEASVLMLAPGGRSLYSLISPSLASALTGVWSRVLPTYTSRWDVQVILHYNEGLEIDLID